MYSIRNSSFVSERTPFSLVLHSSLKWDDPVICFHVILLALLLWEGLMQRDESYIFP